ncbi:MAG: glycosyltransferase [Candidatus Diapherotrites archaeon]|nr:glycosyltransferase [Candidatus Diapherotrites archaeon]
MTKLKASVVIPSYNAAKHLPTLIESLSSQTIKPFEIIIVDDGSTDDTEKIVKKYKLIKYFKKKNGGPAKARNFGALKSKGEIIVFTDSDCTPDKNWLSEMTKPFSDKKVGGVQGAYKTKQKELVARFSQIEIEERYERMKAAKDIDWVGSYSAAYRAEVFKKLKGFDESFPIASGEDPELSYRVEKEGWKLVFNSKAIVYHIHPHSLRKYLKTKFFRAYYRPKMYAGHKEKMLNDSYTPQALKFQIILFYLMILSLILMIFNVIFGCFFGLFLATHIVLGTKLFNLAWKKDKLVALASMPLLILRSVVFGTGLIWGMVKK